MSFSLCINFYAKMCFLASILTKIVILEPLAETTQVYNALLHSVLQSTPLSNI